jgi:DeoR/GlpR family transcriptional regulator of sugar metabolism
MLTQQRKQYLLEILAQEGRIIAKTCAAKLGLSEDTIRRDLRALARDGLLIRVHGGAMPASSAVQSIHARRSISVPEKLAIARTAAAMIQPGQVVFLDGGTTAVQLARHIDRKLKATIVTHSPMVAAELGDHALDVHCIGGRLFKHSMVSIGATAIEAVHRIRADVYFAGVTGIHPEIGLTTGDAEEAAIKRAMAEASADVIVPASPEKLGAVSPFVISPASVMSTLIVHETTAEPAFSTFLSMEIEIIRAPAKI